ncbi:MAG: radical SAM/SPASM domain-containing protein [archaeon]
MSSNHDYSSNLSVDGIFGNDFDDDIIKGINSADQAFRGPLSVQIDLTNTCNLNCVACWCYSELMEEKKFTPDIIKLKLSKNRVMELVHELNDLNVRHICLSGGGDPSTHPNFMEVVREIKLLKIKLTIVTNFTLWTKEMIDKCVEYEVDNLNVSMWAATPETYVKLHPNQNEKTFQSLIEKMKYLHSAKKGAGKPYVKYFSVISSYNFFEIDKMVEMALRTGSDSIEYQIVDIVEGKTDSLRLTEDMTAAIAATFEKLKERDDYFDEFCIHDIQDASYRPEHISFGRFIKQIPDGFKFERESLKLRCPKRYLNKERHTDDKNIKSFQYWFDDKICSRCTNQKICFKEKPFVHVEFLNLLGHGAFTRRMNSKNNNGIYDENVVEKIPCYVGWTYTRILPNGDVIPCCKGHRMPIGNIMNKRLKEIWYSSPYNIFREMAKTKSKKHPYFSKIDCLRCCDNLGMNIESHAKMLSTK